MKQFLSTTTITLLILSLVSCAGLKKAKDGCGNWKDVQKHDSRKFRVQHINPTDSGIWVTLKRWDMRKRTSETVKTFCKCDRLPDSVRVGKYVSLYNL